jgi:hypothetical protein
LNGTKEVVGEGSYNCENITIVNDYDIINPTSIIDSLVKYVGRTYTDYQLDSTMREGVLNSGMKINYDIRKNGSVQMAHTWRLYQQIDLVLAGFIQQGKLVTTDYPSIKKLMPKTFPISDGTKTWKFYNVEDFSTNPTGSINFTSEYWRNSDNPPHRTVDLLGDGSVDKVGFAMGYDLRIGEADNRANTVNDAWFIYSTGKSYPRALDTKIGIEQQADSVWNFNTYRQFFNAERTDSATSFYYYENNGDIRVVFDYHNAVNLDL